MNPPIEATSAAHSAAVADCANHRLDLAGQLLEQYRLALTDIVNLAGAYAAPMQAGSPLEEVLWIVTKRGLGQPLTGIEQRRRADDYPRDRAEALDVMQFWPADWLTERQLIAAQQLLRVPPDTVQ